MYEVTAFYALKPATHKYFISYEVAVMVANRIYADTDAVKVIVTKARTSQPRAILYRA